MKAIKNINNYSSNCTYNHHNTIEYIGVYSKPSSSCESRPSTNSSSITKYNKKDFIWILAHNSNGVITGKFNNILFLCLFTFLLIYLFIYL